MFALQSRIEAMARTYGLERIGMQTLTIRENITDVMSVSFKMAKAQSVTEFETAFIRKMLAEHNGNVTKAANAAKQNRRVFRRLMQKYHIPVRIRKARRE